MCFFHLPSHSAPATCLECCIFLSFFMLELQGCVLAHITVNKLTTKKNSTSKMFMACFKLADFNSAAHGTYQVLNLGGWSPSEVIFDNETKKKVMAVFQIMYSITYHLEILNVFNQMMAGCLFHSGDAIFNFYFSTLEDVWPKPELQGDDNQHIK